MITKELSDKKKEKIKEIRTNIFKTKKQKDILIKDSKNSNINEIIQEYKNNI